MSATTSRVGAALLPVLLVVAGSVAGGPAQGPIPEQEPRPEPLLDPGHDAWSVRAPELFRARFRTSEGDFVVEAFRRWAPHGADRLYNLVRLGFYDDTRVYRVREGVFAQFGLSGEPAVNELWYERTLPDDPRRRSNLRGMVSYAMLPEPDTRTTQLFVNLRDNPEFDEGGFTPVGRVVEGMEVVDAFYAGYGDEAGGGMRGGRQGRIVEAGNAHLDADFPLLSRIESASIEPGRVLRYPDLGPNRIRAELHLLPAVSTGPMDPTWSPDSDRLAFAMRGDIWVVDAAGGEAEALTRGPGYYSEPAWSPDGKWIAFSRDLDGNLDIGVIPAAGGEAVMLTTHEHVDVQPAWGADSRHVWFASAREGDLDLYRVPAGREGQPQAMVRARGHQFQPAISPDGRALAFASPVRGQIGTGGIWTSSLGPDGAPVVADGAGLGPTDVLEGAALVFVEETAFRTEPAWSADGLHVVFVSDEAGSNDLAAVPADGGSKVRLTHEEGDELDPAPSPDGRRVAFVSNRAGPTRLMLADAGGARRQAWIPVTISSIRPVERQGQLTIEVRDTATDTPTTARVHVLASDERGYAPEGGFHRVISATDMHYFHTEGRANLSVPAGRVRVEAHRGPEFLPASGEVDVVAGEEAVIVLEPRRMVDMEELGWVSGDTHSHDLHQGRFGLGHEDYFRQLVAEDLQVTNALIHMDGTRLMGRWDDLTGEPHPLSTEDHVLQYAQEFRGSFGHVGLLGISEFVMPLIGGATGTPFAPDVLNARWLAAAHDQGGIGGYMHPYSRPVEEPEDAAFSEIALDVALGAGDFYDVASYPYDDLVNAAMYWRFLSAGFPLPASGGSDNFADVWRDAPPGSARTYAKVDGPPDVPAWLAAVKAGLTFATNGPLVLLTAAPVDAASGEVLDALRVGPGNTIGLGAVATDRISVGVEVASVAPLDRVAILVNGRVAHDVDVRGRGHGFSLERTVRVPGSGWIAAMVTGPAARAVTDAYPFAHTTPAYVVRGGEHYIDPEQARFLAGVVRAQWEIVRERDRFPDEAARERYRAAVEAALEVYERRAGDR